MALFWRGLVWRRGFSVAVLLVGIISAAVAAIGPLYARAASESTLTDELRDVGSGTGMAFSNAAPAAGTTAVSDAVAAIGRAAHVPGYGPAIRGQSSLITAGVPGERFTTVSTMVSRAGQCAHLVMVAGRCPARAGEAVVPEAAHAGAPNWRIGQTLTIHQRETADYGSTADGPVMGHTRIVGYYRARDTAEPYWFALPYFNAELGPAVTSAIKGGIDAIFVDQRQFLRAPLETPSEVDIDVPLIAAKVRLDDVAALARNVAAVQRRFPNDGGATESDQDTSDLSGDDDSQVTITAPAMRTGLPAALADAARDKRQVDTATRVVILELAALSLLVLFQVVGGAVEARGDEVALAKLRGLQPWRTIVFALNEPVALLLVAAPLGLVVALGVTHLLAATVLVGGTPVALTSATGWALAAAFAGSAVAAGLAAVKTVTRPVLEQWRITSPPRRGAVPLLVLDIALAAAALSTLIALRSGDSTHPRPVFLIAPALMVFAVALLGIRLLPLLGRYGLRPTRASRRVATFLALRQTVRRPTGLRLATLLAVAVGLATFAICGEAVAAGNRAARAQTELGGSRRLSVQFEPGHDPQTAVAKADPRGRWAMAVATWSPDGGSSSGGTVVGSLMGVDSGRLAATMFPVRGQLSPPALAAAIKTAVSPPATFHATELRVSLTLTSLVGDRSTLGVNVRPTHGQATEVPAGPLRLGTHQYLARVDCAGGCEFAGLVFDRSYSAQQGTITGRATLNAVDAGTGNRFATIPLRLGSAAAWRASEVGIGASSTINASPAGIVTTFRSTDASSPALVYADTPAAVPIVAAPKSVTGNGLTGTVADYTQTSVPYRVTRTVGPLPVVLDAGAIGSLDYLRIRLPNFDIESAWTVWLGPRAPADALARLQRAGLLVQNVRTEATRQAELGRQGPALGLLLLLLCAIAAAVLAVGGTAVALLADGRRRAFEMAALRVAGVRHQTLRRAAIIEQAMLLGAAVVLGLPSGYLAATLVLPVVPEFSDPTPVVLHYGPSILLALACVAAFAALLIASAVVAGSALARAAVPARLREAAR